MVNTGLTGQAIVSELRRFRRNRQVRGRFFRIML